VLRISEYIKSFWRYHNETQKEREGDREREREREKKKGGRREEKRDISIYDDVLAAIAARVC
jgi:hypothetical protein